MTNPFGDPSLYRLHHDARSSASPLMATSTPIRKLSHATIRHPRTRTTSNPPFQVSLNLLMKVQPLGNDEYCAEPIELSVNDINVNMPKKVQQHHRGKQQPQLGDSSVVYPPYTWMSDKPRRKNCERGRAPSVADEANSVSDCLTDYLNRKNDKNINSSSSSGSDISYIDISCKAVSCVVDFGYMISKWSNHVLIRFEFFLNDVKIATNLLLNLRSDEEVLYFEPVELSYKSVKLWERPVEILAHDMKANIVINKLRESMITPFGHLQNFAELTNASFSFDDVTSKNVVCEVNLGKKHITEEQIRIGFLANGLYLAINLVLKIRSNTSLVFFEPHTMFFKEKLLWCQSSAEILANYQKKKETVAMLYKRAG